MAGIAVNDIWEVKIGTYCAGQAGLNVRHYIAGVVTGTSATDIQLALLLDNLFAPLYKPLMAFTATYYGVQVQRVQPLPRTSPVVSAANVGIGTGGTSALPTQVSGIVTLQTGFAGRAFRGRAYVPFPSSASNDAVLDRPTPGYVGPLLALGVAMRTAALVGTAGNTVNMLPVLYHRATGTSSFLTFARANAKWATQRKRGNYGQPNPYPPF